MDSFVLFIIFFLKFSLALFLKKNVRYVDVSLFSKKIIITSYVIAIYVLQDFNFIVIGAP